MALTATIVSKFDNSGIRKAEKGFGRLVKGSMRSKLALGALAASFVAMGKAGVEAAADDAAAMHRLDQTLRNAGFGKAVGPVEEYISNLERATGVVDDELRPAFQRMFGVLNDANASMGLMNAAMNISAGTGKSLDEVTTTLTKAIMGQRRGLVGLGLGIDAATAKTISMNDVMQIAEDRFGGMSAQIAGTPLGQLNKIKTAFSNLQETIGYSFLEGLGNSDEATQKFITDIEVLGKTLGIMFGNIAKWTAGAIRGVEDMLRMFGLMDDQVLATGANMVDFIEVGAVNMQRFAITKDMIDQKMAQLALDKQLATIQARQDAATKKTNAAAAKSLAIKKALAKWDSALINIEAAKKRSNSQSTVDRLLSLQSDTLMSQGLTAGQAGMTTGNKVSAPSVQVVVQGSVITERNLMDAIRRDVTNMMSDRGRWGDVG